MGGRSGNRSSPKEVDGRHARDHTTYRRSVNGDTCCWEKPRCKFMRTLAASISEPALSKIATARWDFHAASSAGSQNSQGYQVRTSNWRGRPFCCSGPDQQQPTRPSPFDWLRRAWQRPGHRVEDVGATRCSLRPQQYVFHEVMQACKPPFEKGPQRFIPGLVKES